MARKFENRNFRRAIRNRENCRFCYGGGGWNELLLLLCLFLLFLYGLFWLWFLWGELFVFWSVGVVVDVVLVEVVGEEEEDEDEEEEEVEEDAAFKRAASAAAVAARSAMGMPCVVLSLYFLSFRCRFG
jgi:hypothetical protein